MWDGRIMDTLFSYFSLQELLYLGRVCKIFYEITGSKVVLDKHLNGSLKLIHNSSVNIRSSAVYSQPSTEKLPYRYVYES